MQRRLVRGDYLLWEDGGHPVSVAGQGRPTRNGVAIGPVYTPAEARGRGYASALVAQLCRQLLAERRRFVTLFADRSNPTANGVYRRVGFAAQGVFAEFDLVRRQGAA